MVILFTFVLHWSAQYVQGLSICGDHQISAQNQCTGEFISNSHGLCFFIIDITGQCTSSLVKATKDSFLEQERLVMVALEIFLSHV